MSDRRFQQKFRIFQNSCKFYLVQKEQYKALLEEYPDLKDYINLRENGSMTIVRPVRRNDWKVPYSVLMLFKLMIENLYYVESVLAEIEKQYGDEEATLVADLLIKGMEQDMVGKKRNLSRRQIQTRLYKILEDVIGGSDGQ